MQNDDIFNGLGVEVTLNKEDDFLKVKETLTRIGIASKKDKRLYQSCHILHKRGRYSILHFKELFILDGKDSDLSEDDIARRNTIVSLLDEWRLLDILDTEWFDEQDQLTLGSIKVLPYSQKKEWELRSKYSIGSK